MASLGGTFNAADVDPTMREFELLPPGDYRVEITESDLVPNKNGTGQVFKYTLRVYEGEHEGATVWAQLNYANATPIAQEIGLREFSALCHATGVMAPEETEELHFKPFLVKLSIDPAKGEYKAKNKVVKVYWDGDGSAPPATASAPATPKETPKAAVIAATRPAPSGGKTPWKRR